MGIVQHGDGLAGVRKDCARGPIVLSEQIGPVPPGIHNMTMHFHYFSTHFL